MTKVKLYEEYHSCSTKPKYKIEEEEEYMSMVFNKQLNIINRMIGEINRLIDVSKTEGEKWDKNFICEPIEFEDNVLTIRCSDSYSKRPKTEVYDLNEYLDDVEQNSYILEDAKDKLKEIKSKLLMSVRNERYRRKVF